MRGSAVDYTQFNSLFTRVVYIPNGGWPWASCRYHLAGRESGTSCTHLGDEGGSQRGAWVATLNMAGPSLGTAVTPSSGMFESMMIFPNLPKVGICFPFLEGKLYSGSTQIFWVSLVGLFTLQVVYLAGRNKGETCI